MCIVGDKCVFGSFCTFERGFKFGLNPTFGERCQIKGIQGQWEDLVAPGLNELPLGMKVMGGLGEEG